MYIVRTLAGGVAQDAIEDRVDEVVKCCAMVLFVSWPPNTVFGRSRSRQVQPSDILIVPSCRRT